MSFDPGIPVPIGGIERELGHLWEGSGDGKTRASMINLAIYSEKPGSLERNTGIIREIAGEHAMRAILVEADPKAEGSNAEAWISMHCYLRGAKGGSVCSEQISFRLAGAAARSLQSVVFSHLDSDLPLALWWQADFHPPIKGKLWRWVDRLLFDSHHWKKPAEQFALIGQIARLAEARSAISTGHAPFRSVRPLPASSTHREPFRNWKLCALSTLTMPRDTAPRRFCLWVGWPIGSDGISRWPEKTRSFKMPAADPFPSV